MMVVAKEFQGKRLLVEDANFSDYELALAMAEFQARKARSQKCLREKQARRLGRGLDKNGWQVINRSLYEQTHKAG